MITVLHALFPELWPLSQRECAGKMITCGQVCDKGSENKVEFRSGSVVVPFVDTLPRAEPVYGSGAPLLTPTTRENWLRCLSLACTIEPGVVSFTGERHGLASFST